MVLRKRGLGADTGKGQTDQVKPRRPPSSSSLLSYRVGQKKPPSSLGGFLREYPCQMDDALGAEAEERWGHTEEFQQSAARTAGYTEADWKQLGDEANEIDAALRALKADGRPADCQAAMVLAEKHRAHISKWFYDCSRQMHAALGEMYIADRRFTDNIDRAGDGLAAYLSEAIAANAARG